MLLNISLVLLVLWLLVVLSGYTFGGLINILLIAGIVLFLVGISSRRGT